MKDLFDPVVADELKQRMMRLRAESERVWGEMTVAQALAHCTAGVQMAMGEIKPKRAAAPANFIGLAIKPLVLGGDRPMRRNAPSVPELLRADPAQCDFERERVRLVEVIDEFVRRGAECCTRHPHPFFGAMTPQEWAILMYKHMDHHLRQFGV